MSAALRACVIGHPVAQSKSPIIHGYWMARHGINGVFDKHNILPTNLAKACAGLAADYRGFSVTLPHKEAMVDICDTLDDAARAIRAVNCVVVRKGQLHGMNTDGYGFMANLGKFDVRDKNVLLLGAGGAVRALVYALTAAGAKLTITNRTAERAQQLAKEFSAKTVPWDDRASALYDVDLLVNGTSLGMTGQAALDLDLSLLPKKALVTDIVYAPLMTDLLRAAQARGNPIVTGIGMLAHQAVPAFDAWFGVRPEVDAELIRRLTA